jgi:hypothetical protein
MCDLSVESPETFVEIPQKLEVSNRSFVVLKPFSIAEETLHNENLLL